MAITLNDLTINLKDVDVKSLLSDWEWAMEEPMRPVLVTAMGDVFAQGKSGCVYFVDVVGGTIECVAEDGPTFEGLLTNSKFVTDLMYPSRVVEFRRAGISLGPNEVYSNRKPLVLGGGDDLENIEPSDVSVHVSIHGQIHQQVKDLPPGTSVKDITIE